MENIEVEVKNEKKHVDHLSGNCPNCGEKLRDFGRVNYCWYCGQKLRWNGERIHRTSERSSGTL